MKALVFATRTDAEARSRAEWEAVLGGPVQKGDGTRFLWPVSDNDDGTASVVVPLAQVTRLRFEEQAGLRDALQSTDGIEGGNLDPIRVGDDIVADEKSIADSTVAGGGIVGRIDG